MHSKYAHLSAEERTKLFLAVIEDVEETYGIELTEDFSCGHPVVRDSKSGELVFGGGED